MVNEEHNAAVHRLLEAFNAQDAAVFDELGTPEMGELQEARAKSMLTGI